LEALVLFIHELLAYLDGAPSYDEIGVLIRSIETGDVIDATFDVIVDIDEYGLLMINIAL